MKNAFTSILLLSVVGLAVLLAGAFYFGAPLFGWIIMIAIFAVFIVEQALALKKLRQMSSESEIIDECERRRIYSALVLHDAGGSVSPVLTQACRSSGP